MMAFYLITTICTLVAYVLYNAMLFNLVSRVLDAHPARWKSHVLTCIVNFGTFFLISSTELPLVFNWTVVAVLFAVEIRLIYRVRWTDCVLGGLMGAAIGLASTLIMRSSCAIVLDVPLSAVNNDVSSIKAVPVALGFLLAAITTRIVDTPRVHRMLDAIRNDRRVVAFLLVEMSLCYLYLCLTLLLYYNDLNTLVVKIWSLKTAVFVSLGVMLGIWFAYRTTSVLGQAKRRASLAQEIERDQQTNLHLRELAEHDALTGCFTRGYAERTMADNLHEGKMLSIVFVDVDRLKQVNDQFGHEAGDTYLAAAASALDQVRASASDFVARYGGDEFLVVLTEPLSPAQISERMNVASRSLRASGREGSFAYEPSMSWGYALSEAGESAEALVARADEAMYRNKRGLKEVRASVLAS